MPEHIFNGFGKRNMPARSSNIIGLPNDHYPNYIIINHDFYKILSASEIRDMISDMCVDDVYFAYREPLSNNLNTRLLIEIYFHDSKDMIAIKLAFSEIIEFTYVQGKTFHVERPISIDLDKIRLKQKAKAVKY